MTSFQKFFCLILSGCLLLSLVACGSKKPVSEPTQADKEQAAGILQGKKVLFVGCSFSYYGGTVCPAGDSTTGTNYADYAQEKRENDNGFFYQLCKANGVDVNVTDWTFGGHTLKEILGGACTRSKCSKGSPEGHLAALKDRYFDYVVLNEIRRDGESAQEICSSIEGYVNIFKDANPNVKVYYIVHDGVYVSNYSKTWLESLELIEKLGVTVLDWGTLVYDVANGDTKVPGATQQYRKNTFMVSQSKDSYHPNILTGYLYALMTYCAITGESAEGQPYGFCCDPSDPAYPISKRFDIDIFKSAYYTLDNPNTDWDERDTNFDKVLTSAKDMKGLQQLVNLYLDDDTNAWKKHLG